jgi:hypothetical protein
MAPARPRAACMLWLLPLPVVWVHVPLSHPSFAPPCAAPRRDLGLCNITPPLLISGVLSNRQAQWKRETELNESLRRHPATEAAEVPVSRFAAQGVLHRHVSAETGAVPLPNGPPPCPRQWAENGIQGYAG